MIFVQSNFIIFLLHTFIFFSKVHFHLHLYVSLIIKNTETPPLFFSYFRCMFIDNQWLSCYNCFHVLLVLKTNNQHLLKLVLLGEFLVNPWSFFLFDSSFICISHCFKAQKFSTTSVSWFSFSNSSSTFSLSLGNSSG